MASNRPHYLQPRLTSGNVAPLPSSPTSHVRTATTSHTHGCIEEIGDQITRSQVDHPNLKQQFDASACPQADHLPFEIISHILGYVCELPSPSHSLSRSAQSPWRAPHNARMTPWARYPPVTLGLVCSYWREIVRSRPDLWTTIKLEFQSMSRSLHAPASILGLYLENSDTLPISLSMKFALGRTWNGLELVHPAVDPLLLRHKNRITKLHLIEPPLSWASFISQLPQLEELFLIPIVNNRVYYPNYTWQISISSDRIQHISLHSQDREPKPWLQDVTLPPLANHLTSLDLRSVPMDICAELLLHQCSTLIEYRCTCPDFPLSRELPWLTKRITLPHLELFDWSCTRYKWATAIIQHIHLLSLKKLRWDEEVARMPNELKKTFFRRHLHTITHIEFNYLPFPQDSPMNWLPTNMSVEHLVLSMCSLVVLEDICTKLTPSSGAQLDTFWLPSLSSVTIGTIWVTDDIVVKVKSTETHKLKLETLFVKMMEARHALGTCAGFQLIDKSAKLEWPSYLRERLLKLNPAPVILSRPGKLGP
ncbi:hypothetical protein P691DRAFT_225384 [Macrolepiota fuliginosa MF-IS2]|uniref:F-box domain-containing protein n=1 Tax=Macrolepiota fuliginosa MF-IS2 TaxID=1400762 RepID=A0A9P5X8P2_9AGAR|nr:hypothetical protein P691DRAFT_225384 [Macrolepiota fuliginosa MF-IS2]